MLVDKIIQLAHEMMCSPPSSIEDAMERWDNLLTQIAGANLVALWAREDEFLKTVYASNRVSMDVRLHPNQSIAAHVYELRRTKSFDFAEVNGSDLDSHPEIIASFDISSALFAPIQAEGEVFGVLGVYFPPDVDSSALGDSFVLPIVDFIAGSILRSGRELPDRSEDELLFASATALNALVSAMSHYHDLSHSNVAALNACSKAYQIAKKGSQLELIQDLTALDGNLRKSSEQLDQIKESYLAISEPKMNVEQINLKELGEQFLGEFGPRAEQSGIEFSVELGEGILVSNRRKVEAIFDNLIRNSFDFVRPITQAKHIRLTRVSEGEVARFELEDNGVGMSEEAVTLAIRPFYSTRNSDGVGLFVVNGFSRQLEGGFEIESELGFGTKATVRIPGLEAHNG